MCACACKGFLFACFVFTAEPPAVEKNRWSRYWSWINDCMDLWEVPLGACCTNIYIFILVYRTGTTCLGTLPVNFRFNTQVLSLLLSLLWLLSSSPIQKHTVGYSVSYQSNLLRRDMLLSFNVLPKSNCFRFNPASASNKCLIRAQTMWANFGIYGSPSVGKNAALFRSFPLSRRYDGAGHKIICPASKNIRGS